VSQQPDDVDARFHELVRDLDLDTEAPPPTLKPPAGRAEEPFSLEAAIDAVEPDEPVAYRPASLPPARFSARGVLVIALAAVAGVIAMAALLGVRVPVPLGIVAVTAAVAATALGLASLRTASHPDDDDGARV